MFEEAITQLDTMGIPYTENEDGSLSIDISGADKTDVVTIISFLNDNGLDYTIDAETIVVNSSGVEADAEILDEETDLGIDDPLAGLLG